MNVSMQDGWNIGWKLGHVLEGRSPEALLSTYSAERQVVAQNLIDFDKEWSTLMATKPEDLPDPTTLEDFYVRTAEFPAGFMTEYAPSMIVGDARASGARHRLPDRQALQVGARHPGLRCQRPAPRAPGPRRRPLAHLRVRAGHLEGAVAGCRRAAHSVRRLDDGVALVPARRDPRGRAARRLVRRQGRSTRRITRTSTSSPCPICSSRRPGRSASSTGRRSTRPTRRTTSSSCAASTAAA